jgi:ATP-binding cassette, subfamily C (CFTR/MRP), member 1
VQAMRTGTQAILEAQRLDSRFRDPVHNTLAMLVDGLVSLRCLNKVAYFRQDFQNNLARGANSTFIYFCANRWIGARLELLSSLFSATVAIICVLSKGIIDAKLLAISLQLATEVSVMMSIIVRVAAEMEKNMISSQRIVDYTRLEIEDDLEKESDKKLKEMRWPSAGKIEFKNVTMRYREGLEPSVKNLSFKI